MLIRITIGAGNNWSLQDQSSGSGGCPGNKKSNLSSDDLSGKERWDLGWGDVVILGFEVDECSTCEVKYRKIFIILIDR